MIKLMDHIRLVGKSNILLVALFFFLLGTHLLAKNQWLILIIIALFLIDWKKVKIAVPELLVLGVFAFSVYNKEYSINFSFAENTTSVGAILMLFVSYLLGLSIKGFLPGSLPNERKLFYLLVGYSIGYILVILYSHIAIPQDNPLTTFGMHVYYENMWSYVRDGKLVSTVIAYNLTLLGVLLPFLIFNFKEFRERKFSFPELFILGGLMLYSLYLGVEMGRRIILLLLLISFIYMVIISLLKISKKYHMHHGLFFAIIIILLCVPAYYYLLQDTLLIKRMITYSIFSDPRFSWWLPGLQCMMDYPMGGGFEVDLRPGKWSKLAHNTWIDIGKSSGVLAFASFVIFYLWHAQYLYKTLINKGISIFMKSLILIISFSLLAVMMIEPVFRSQKVFIFYSIFLLGFLKAYSGFYTKVKQNSSDTSSIGQKT